MEIFLVQNQNQMLVTIFHNNVQVLILQKTITNVQFPG